MCSLRIWMYMSVVFLLSLSTSYVQSYSYSLYNNHGHENKDTPCYGCQLFRFLQRDKSHSRRAVQRECSKSCYCPEEELKCNDGVRKIRDGCNCCFMCARQHGEVCSVKDKCDIQKQLYCDVPVNGVYGLCRAFEPKPCIVNGVKYKDSEKFNPDCRRLCTCQNGNYGCVSLCPQEDNKPSVEHCPNAKLTSVRDQCCKEWTCYQEVSVKAPRHLPVQSANLMMSYNQLKHSLISHAEPGPICDNDSDWSACSVTCGIGESWRIAPRGCHNNGTHETRICYLRPCDKNIQTVSQRRCSPTTRLAVKQHIEYGSNCRSLRKYRMKVCTTCRKNRCCYPKMQKTRNIAFRCGHRYLRYYKFSWIKKCMCTRRCRRNMNRKKRNRNSKKRHRT